MKKLLAILLSLVMILCLFAACGDSDDDDDDDGDGKGKGSSSSSSYKDPIDRALAALSCQITKSETKAMFPAEYWEVQDFNEYWENTESQMESSKEAMEAQIGKNVKYSYEVTEKTELTGDDLDEIKEHLADEYGIDEADVEKAYNLDFEYTIEGDEDEVSGTSEDAVVICIRGEWHQYPF